MSETTRTTATLPRVMLAPERGESDEFGRFDGTYLDTRLAACLKDFYALAGVEHRNICRELESVDEKVNYMCWIWAESPETVDRAVDLRSLLVTRTLENAVLRPQSTGAKDYQLFTGDQFWARVDEQVYENLSEFVKDTAHAALAPFVSLPVGVKTPIFEFNDYIIERMAEASGSGMVHYYAQPRTLSY